MNFGICVIDKYRNAFFFFIFMKIILNSFRDLLSLRHIFRIQFIKKYFIQKRFIVKKILLNNFCACRTRDSMFVITSVQDRFAIV